MMLLCENLDRKCGFSDMLHFGSLLPPCKPPLLRILPLLPHSHQGIETLAKVHSVLGCVLWTICFLFQAQQLVMMTPPPCSLLACTDNPISLMVQQTPAAAPLKLLVQHTPAVAPIKSSSLGPCLPVGSARRSFLPPTPTPIKRRKPLDLQSSIAPPVSKCSPLLSPIPTYNYLSSQYKLEESSLAQSNSFSNPGGPSGQNTLQPPVLGQFDWPTTLIFSSTQPQKKLEKEPKKGPNLERVRKLTFGGKWLIYFQVAYVLSHDLLNMFLKSQEWEMYHPNMILQDNIRGKRLQWSS